MVRIEWNEHEFDRMLQDPTLRADAEDTAAAVADLARGMAPQRTGAGAASLSGAAVFEGGAWALRVGADQLHAYMRFPDRGTRYVAAQSFLENAAQQVAHRGR